ncbi:hypothetical protein AQJ23_28070 [Streptomyces antibioticus]|nr:hypothetical protein [Streptomyces antibioticus]KUN21919.1 hypothetical protein AQJ23_28070 [Streptomyces antibioticus]
MDPSFMAQQQAQQASQQAQQAHQQAVNSHRQAHQQHVRHGYHRPPMHTPMPHRGGRGGGLVSLLVVIVVAVVLARDPELRDTVLNEIQKLADRIGNS